MEGPEDKMSDEYLEKKRAELRIFFEDAKLSKEILDKVIENELRPLKEGRAYIKAQDSEVIKTEYEVMTGQPFTKVADQDHPLSPEEVNELLKNSPAIAEKARQIHIVTKADKDKEVAVRMEDIQLAGYDSMLREIESAGGDRKQINDINYKHMQSLATSLSDFKAKNAEPQEPEIVEEPDTSDEDYKEYDVIEKEVIKHTHKSYETRYQETKDMLLKLADRFDEPQSSSEAEKFCDSMIFKDPVLQEASVHVQKGQSRKTVFEEIKESYSINKAMNIPLKDNPVVMDLSGQSKNKAQDENNKESAQVDVEEVLFSTTFEAKLKDTENVLREINSVLNNVPAADESKKQMSDEINTDRTELGDNNTVSSGELEKPNQRFDERMEQTLQNALENINRENLESEYMEMKGLAKNIVEGAENFNTLIQEDITNKLNSMNELLNDVNVALETSRKSNIVYQKIQDEGDMLRERVMGNTIVHGTPTITEIIETEEVSKETSHCSVSDAQIDDIRSAIGKLNKEILCHETRINESQTRYEKTNAECKTFMTEVDEILQKSNSILHPVNESNKHFGKSLDAPADEIKVEKEMKTEEIVRKELWDIDLDVVESVETRKNKIAEYQEQHEARNKRIDDLLRGIKDNMKDNKEVIRLANNLLRREETKKKSLSEKGEIEEIDDKAQGDHAGANSGSELGQNDKIGKQIGTLLRFVIKYRSPKNKHRNLILQTVGLI